MSDYAIHHLNDDGADGAILGTAPDIDTARQLGDEQAADPDYPWYRIYRNGEHVETCQSYPSGYYDPEHDGAPPIPTDRESWPRPVDRRHQKEMRGQMTDHQPPL